jgi:hypothetical protein
VESLRHFATTDPITGDPVKLTKQSIASALSRRPWNNIGKTLAFKIAQQFKFRNKHPECYYGRIYTARKELEVARNEQGAFAAQAADVLRRTPHHAQASTYRQGKLPQGHLDARALRYTAKRFLADWWYIAYKDHFKQEPPLPYPIAHQDHAHFVPPPSPVAEDVKGETSVGDRLRTRRAGHKAARQEMGFQRVMATLKQLGGDALLEDGLDEIPQ